EDTLLLASDGNYYGMTRFGGDVTPCPPNGCGTIFRVDDSGNLTTIHVFEGPDGQGPTGALIEASDGDFYGTTVGGGAAGGWGTLFKISPSGELTTLYSFSGGADGGAPYAGVIQCADGNFYGVASAGGAAGDGVVFTFGACVPASGTVSGGGLICPGGSTTIRADLEGPPPWTVSWSDGQIDAGL